MPYIDKTIDFQHKEDNNFYIDLYQTNTHLPAIEINRNGNLQLKNFSDEPKSDNFYGDGRLGVFQKRDTTNIRPASAYCQEVKNHDVYGWCLYRCWYQSSTYNPGDEVVIYKKHIQHETYIDELGTWEYMTIKEQIIDSVGTHYTLEAAPKYEYSSHTANAISLVLQYESLDILDNQNFKIDFSANSTCDMPADLWNGRRLSLPDGILAVKLQKELKIGRNAFIGSMYGYNGSSTYYNLEYINDYHVYADAGAPLGCGTDSRTNASYSVSADIRDIRSAGHNRVNLGDYRQNIHEWNDFFGPGGIGSYGIKHESDTFFGNAMPASTNLNEKIYNGLGGANFFFGMDVSDGYYNNDNYQSNHGFGRAGGGIVVIQTPKIIFMDAKSKILAYGTSTDSRRRLGYGSGGSILVKSEIMEFYGNPALKSKYDETPVVDTTNCSFTTVNGLSTSYSKYFSPPGQIQLEFDAWKVKYDNIIDDAEDINGFISYTPNTLSDDVIKNHIYDFYSNYKKQEAGLLGTLIDWNTSLFLKNHNFTAPKYETGKYFKFKSQGTRNLDISFWQEIISIETKYDLPSGTDIRVVFSTNLGASWQYINMDGAVPVITSTTLSDTDLGTKSNTMVQLKEFVNSAFLTNMFIYNQSAKTVKTIDYCIAIKTTKSHITPMLDRIWLNYEGVGALGQPIPMSPFNGEEFNNEYVNFVWLQPQSKDGSIQNRIEISPIPNFDKNVIEVVANPEDISSSNGKIHLPYKPSKFDNVANETNYFKLPYMKKRMTQVLNSSEELYNSLQWDYSNKKVKYPVGDVYFRKGNTSQLAAQADLAIPSELDFTLKSMVVKPRADKLRTHFNFTNINVLSKENVQDLKSPNDWDLVNSSVGNALVLENNTTHGKTPLFLDTTNSYISFRAAGSFVTDQNSWIKRSNQGCTLVRFNARNLTYNADNYIFGTFNHHWGVWHQMYSLYPYIDSTSGDKCMRIGYYNGYYWYHFHRKGILDNTENVLLLNRRPDNNCDIFLNGIKIFNNIPAHHYDTSNTSYYSATSEFRLHFGTEYNFSGSKFNGEILEYAAWDCQLTIEEILSVSKVPTYHLRYDFIDNKIKWFRVPYKTHLSKYKFVNDNVDNFEGSSSRTRWEITNQHFAFNNSDCYRSNNDSLLFGTYSPGYSEAENLKRHEANYKPINGIPFLLNRTGGGGEKANELQMKYNDSNTLYQASGDYHSYLLSHNRILAAETNIGVSFVYKDLVNNLSSSDIGIATGSFDQSEVIGISYSRYMYIRYSKSTGKCTLYYAVRHSNNSCYTQINYADLPYDLKDNNIYNLEIRVNDSVNSSTIWLSSLTDSDYVGGKILFQPNAASYSVSSHGFDTDNFNDITHGFLKPYENYSAMIRTGTNQCFELIDLYHYNEQSSQLEVSGYVSRYDLYKNINPDGLKKLNYLEFKGVDEMPEANVKIYFSFDGGLNYKRYDFTNKKWISANVNDLNTAMSIDETMKISTYQFNQIGGFVQGQGVQVRLVWNTSNPIGSSFMDYVKISYNGPTIIDSWDEPGSFYSAVQFYYADSTWNPYTPVDFTDDAQQWVEMGSAKPSHSTWNSTMGSRGSWGPRKIFAGCRLLLSPKGRYYWRVASYNGI